ncbi:MAG: IPT/TIG domain-containing protein, partial [Anaerolineae bacterium]
GVVAMDAGDRISLALLSSGQVVGWGISTVLRYPPGDAQPSVAIAEGDTFNLALRPDGRVVAWGFEMYDATHVPAEAQSGVLAIAAGWYHGLALKAGPAPATPFVTNVTASPASGSFKAGDSVDVSVQFSQAVNVTGTPQLLVAASGAGTPAHYSGGSGTATLTFRYTVQPGDNTADLDYVSRLALAFESAGTIRGTAGNAASLLLPVPGTAGSLGYNASIVIDTEGPVATWNAPADGSQIICSGDPCLAMPTLSGVASTGPGDLAAVTLRVYRDIEVDPAWLVQTLTANAAADGSYSVATSAPLAPWAYTVQVEQRDALGNVGLSVPITFRVVPPTPVITGVSPASLEVGSTETITLLGTGFVGNTQVDWTEPATMYFERLTPDYIAEGQLTFSAPAGHVNVPKTVELWAYSPLGQGSWPQPYLITPAGVSVVDSATASASGPISGTATAEIPGVVSAAGHNIGLVYVAQYSDNPVGSAGFPVGGHYVNVCLNGGNNFREVEIRVCDPSFTSADSLHWWDPTAGDGSGGWLAVSPAAGFDASSRCLTFMAYQYNYYGNDNPDTVSVPSTEQLTGTVFAVSHVETRAATNLAVSPASGTYGGSVTLEATLTTGASMPVEGVTVSFTLDGVAACGTPSTPACPSTDRAGVASLAGVELWTLEAGDYSAAVGASYAGGDTHLASTGTADLTVEKADATISVVPYSVIFDGNPHTATGTATGVLGKPLLGLDLSGTTHTSVGSYTDAWTFSSANYNDASGTVTNSILYPLPVMAGISPASAAAGSPDDVSVTITGTGLVSGSAVRWNGEDLVTAHSSDTQLVATIPAGHLSSVQTARIT